ncbi:MAG TPA: PASTA domain-containing protein, partial [Candidatus Acidoferrales bacterium]|nr:PASTA domain-containing protein [Candidatus Acidoferrales bacterium]
RRNSKDLDFTPERKQKAAKVATDEAKLVTVPESTTVAIAEGQAVTVPTLTGKSVRAVIEACSRLGLTPVLVGNGIAVEQNPDAGTKVLPGAKVIIRFGTGEAASTPGNNN